MEGYGDGEPELASAGGDRYVVFDLECDADPLPAGCEARGVRWSQPSVDHSSNMTGSSVFDFEGDGAAEAVYADECFVRIYDGTTGTVKFSQARSSATTYENPVIADVDGDFNSEIVTSVNDYAGREDCPAEDPLFAGAMFELSHGIRVYRDVEDRWGGSRAIWNQHAYSVTNVTERGQIPRTSEWVSNWLVPGLDNFRQNVQGTAIVNPAPDLTARGEGFETESCGEAPRIVLHATVCNRGTEPVGAGIGVSFEDASPDAAPGPLCETHTVGALGPGHCEPVECACSSTGKRRTASASRRTTRACSRTWAARRSTRSWPIMPHPTDNQSILHVFWRRPQGGAAGMRWWYLAWNLGAPAGARRSDCCWVGRSLGDGQGDSNHPRVPGGRPHARELMRRASPILAEGGAGSKSSPPDSRHCQARAVGAGSVHHHARDCARRIGRIV